MCIQSSYLPLTCTHVETHIRSAHQYDVPDGNSPKQLRFGVGVQHHVARMPVARHCQGVGPRHVSTGHLQLQKKNQIKFTQWIGSLASDQPGWPSSVWGSLKDTGSLQDESTDLHETCRFAVRPVCRKTGRVGAPSLKEDVCEVVGEKL